MSSPEQESSRALAFYGSSKERISGSPRPDAKGVAEQRLTLVRLNPGSRELSLRSFNATAIDGIHGWGVTANPTNLAGQQ